MSFNSMANLPVEMTLNGKKVLVRQVKLLGYFGRAEVAVISKQLEVIREMASHIVNVDERVAFMTRAVAEAVPSGDKLRERADVYVRSSEGIQQFLIESLKTDQPNITKEDLDMDLLDKAEVKAIVDYGLGKAGGSSPLAD